MELLMGSDPKLVLVKKGRSVNLVDETPKLKFLLAI